MAKYLIMKHGYQKIKSEPELRSKTLDTEKNWILFCNPYIQAPPPSASKWAKDTYIWWTHFDPIKHEKLYDDFFNKKNWKEFGTYVSSEITEKT